MAAPFKVADRHGLAELGAGRLGSAWVMPIISLSAIAVRDRTAFRSSVGQRSNRRACRRAGRGTPKS
jgi:hypothetical protein